MSRVPKGEGRRKRMLADDEIRRSGRAGAIRRLCSVSSMTAQRREKLVTLRWDDVKYGVWIIRTDAREKGIPAAQAAAGGAGYHTSSAAFVSSP